MKCKNCKRTIDDDSIFCKWCGEKQIKDRRKKEDIRVPTPRQLKSGKWNIELRAEGQSITEDTAALCKAKAKAIRAGFLEEKRMASTKLTLRQAIDSLLDEYGEALSASTVRGYEIIKKHRFPEKIDMPLRNTSGWQAVIDNARKTYSAKTIRNSWGLVVEVMHKNRVEVPEVILPQTQDNELPWLTYEEILKFTDAISGQKWESDALFALHSLRLSEVYALTWDHIDLKKRIITVSGAVVLDKDNTLIKKKENKNKSSQRKIRIMIPALYDRLCQLQAAGKPPLGSTPNSLTGCINNVCRKNGLPECGTHGLRRSFASLGFHVGLSELEVQEIGGWHDHNTVHKIYLKLAAADRLSAQNKMERFYINRGDVADQTGSDSSSATAPNYPHPSENKASASECPHSEHP